MGEFASELVALLGRLASPLFGPIRWVWILVHDRPDVRITFETYTPRAGGPPSYYAELVNHGPRQVELARAGYSYGDRKLKEQSFMLEVETNRVGTTRGERRRGLPVELGYRQAAQAALHVEHLVDDTGRVARELFYEDWTRDLLGSAPGRAPRPSGAIPRRPRSAAQVRRRARPTGDEEAVRGGRPRAVAR